MSKLIDAALHPFVVTLIACVIGWICSEIYHDARVAKRRRGVRAIKTICAHTQDFPHKRSDTKWRQ